MDPEVNVTTVNTRSTSEYSETPKAGVGDRKLDSKYEQFWDRIKAGSDQKTCCRPLRGGLLSPCEAVVANGWKRAMSV